MRKRPVLTILLILIATALWRSGGTLGDRINDRARIAWGLSTHAPERQVRNSAWTKIGAITRLRPVLLGGGQPAVWAQGTPCSWK